MSFWEQVLEAQPVLIDAAAHDRQLAWTSHLPQAVAYALAKALADRGLAGVSFGTGARDTTRLAASSPDMWIDILLYNRDGAGRGARAHGAEPGRASARCSRAGDEDGLRAYLAAAQRFREGSTDDRGRRTCRVPGDKSITHRALLLAALARGESHVGGALTSLDARSQRPGAARARRRDLAAPRRRAS